MFVLGDKEKYTELEKKYNIERFIKAQKKDYVNAKQELIAGKKRTHWMWYIFPQIKGLGFSNYSVYYAISNLEEAKVYLENKYLRNNLYELCQILLEIQNTEIKYIFGSIDEIKLCSSMTLFSYVIEEYNLDYYNIFDEILKKYYNGKKDFLTLEKIEKL